MPAELAVAFAARDCDANKYTVGTVAIVGGSVNFPHAPAIAALGARAAGAGLVRLVAPAGTRVAAAMLVPEATLSRLSVTCVPPRSDVMALGMGLGLGRATETLVTRLISGASGRYVLDADALTELAAWYGSKGGYKPETEQEIILTPHEGEAARLLGWNREQVANARKDAALEIAARYHAVVILKGNHTLVVSADGKRIYENNSGNPFMAMGGMGDLLAGVVAARWAYYKNDAYLAAAAAVWLHARASDILVSRRGDPSIVNTAAAIGALRVELESTTSLSKQKEQ